MPERSQMEEARMSHAVRQLGSGLLAPSDSFQGLCLFRYHAGFLRSKAPISKEIKNSGSVTNGSDRKCVVGVQGLKGPSVPRQPNTP